MNSYLNITAYKFIALEHLPVLQADLHEFLEKSDVKGTVLLAEEGINVALAGTDTQIKQCMDWFSADNRFANMPFKQSRSGFLPFSKLKVKIRHEIISFGQSGIDPIDHPAPRISAEELKRWLDEGRQFTLLDTRNTYEVESGTFSQAVAVNIQNFREFGAAIEKNTDIDRNLPVVTFCTGGVRCEKAAPWLLANGFDEVLQIDGGILRYFEQCGSEHWDGSCFVFDDRVELDTALSETGAVLCKNCHRAVSREHQQSPHYTEGHSCPACGNPEQAG